MFGLCASNWISSDRHNERLKCLMSSTCQGDASSSLDVIIEDTGLRRTQVFAKAGLESPVIGSIIVGSVNVAGTLLAAMLMDRAGRRQLLLSSHTFMAICLTALSVSTFLPCALPSRQSSVNAPHVQTPTPAVLLCCFHAVFPM